MAIGCLYCDRDQSLKNLMLDIGKLDASNVFLFKEQTYYGRCVVAYKEHGVELYQLNDNELLTFMKDVNRVAAAIKKLFNPEKINYGAYSDKLNHLHVHLAPKYVDGADFGGIFYMNPQKKYLTAAGYEGMVRKLKTELGL
jgi:diadenosine tetraphosphate (Ap4A) HIT family hydrolase